MSSINTSRIRLGFGRLGRGPLIGSRPIAKRATKKTIYTWYRCHYRYGTRYTRILGNSQGRGLDLPVRLPWESPSPEVDKCVSHTQQDANPCKACSAFFKVRDEGARWRVRGDGFRSLAPPTIQENYGRGTSAV